MPPSRSHRPSAAAATCWLSPSRSWPTRIGCHHTRTGGDLARPWGPRVSPRASSMSRHGCRRQPRACSLIASGPSAGRCTSTCGWPAFTQTRSFFGSAVDRQRSAMVQDTAALLARASRISIGMDVPHQLLEDWSLLAGRPTLDCPTQQATVGGGADGL